MIKDFEFTKLIEEFDLRVGGGDLEVGLLQFRLIWFLPGVVVAVGEVMFSSLGEGIPCRVRIVVIKVVIKGSLGLINDGVGVGWFAGGSNGKWCLGVVGVQGGMCGEGELYLDGDVLIDDFVITNLGLFDEGSC